MFDDVTLHWKENFAFKKKEKCDIIGEFLESGNDGLILYNSLIFYKDRRLSHYLLRQRYKRKYPENERLT